MQNVFERTSVGSLVLKNRLFRSATYDGVSDATGHVTDSLVEIYEGLAKGGVGSIITGLAAVTDDEKILPGQMGIYDDSFIEDYRKLVGAVHRYGANIIIQLAALGPQTVNNDAHAKRMLGPSSVADIGYGYVPEEMSHDDIAGMERAFAQAALRAKRAGFDGVQIHAAHGYLLSRFLTPYYNHRTDMYGGSIDNRGRMLMETYAAVREAVGTEYPVLVKINCDDFMTDGMTFDDCVYMCGKLAAAGVTMLEISGGSRSSRENEGYSRKIAKGKDAYFANHAQIVKAAVNVPVISVGGHRDLHAITKLLRDGIADYFSVCRPLICESALVNRWANGDDAPAKCISCNKCSTFGAKVCVLHNSQ